MYHGTIICTLGHALRKERYDEKDYGRLHSGRIPLCIKDRIKIVVITIYHLQINQISALKEVDTSLNKLIKKTLMIRIL